MLPLGLNKYKPIVEEKLRTINHNKEYLSLLRIKKKVRNGNIIEILIS